MESMVIFCADIGSIPKQNFAWARGEVFGNNLKKIITGEDINKLVDMAAQDINSNVVVAIGFECPLFIPIRNKPQQIGSARVGRNGRNAEGSRSWSASAGAMVLATGIPQTFWILKEIYSRVKSKEVPAFMDWKEFVKAEKGIFLWEAFVTSHAKGESHQEDAKKAVQTFAEALPNIEENNAVHEIEVISLIGTVLVATGWSSNLSLLKKSCLVIKAK
ncbi:MAG: hypothetical protein PHU44_17810 [Syntrophales bacterium]|nr:hypothetical protein [Syntrophales bacterium]